MRKAVIVGWLEVQASGAQWMWPVTVDGEVLPGPPEPRTAHLMRQQSFLLETRPGRRVSTVVMGFIAVMLLSACLPSGYVKGEYAWSQTGATLMSTKQTCEDAAEVVAFVDRATPLLQVALLSRGVVPRNWSRRAEVCLISEPEPCYGGDGKPRRGCTIDRSVVVSRWWPPLPATGRSSSWRCDLVHELAHVLDKVFDPAHTQTAIYGAGGAVDEVCKALEVS